MARDRCKDLLDDLCEDKEACAKEEAELSGKTTSEVCNEVETASRSQQGLSTLACRGHTHCFFRGFER